MRFQIISSIFLVLFSFSIVNAQIYMSGVAPLEPGNLWKYYDIGWFGAQSNFYVTDSVKSIGNIVYHIVEEYQDKNPTRYEQYFGLTQDDFYVRYETSASDSIYKYYRKDCNLGDTWIQQIPGFFTFYYAVVDTFTINTWGKSLFSRVIKITDSSLVEVYQVWADSIGLMEENSIGQYHMILRGCVINGIVYGDTTTVGVEDEPELPRDHVLFQNYPNPFNPRTNISFYLSVGSDVLLKVYNLFGEEVKTLVDEYRTAGRYTEIFYGEGLPSGVYLYRLNIGGYIVTKKMILLK